MVRSHCLVVRALHRSGVPMTAKQIGEAESFAYEQEVYNALNALSKKPDSPVIRDKPEGAPAFVYRLATGVLIADYLAALDGVKPPQDAPTESAGPVTTVDTYSALSDKRWTCVCGNRKATEFALKCVTCYQAEKNALQEKQMESAVASDVPTFIKPKEAAAAPRPEPAPAPKPTVESKQPEKIGGTPTLVVMEDDGDMYDLKVDPLLVALVLKLPRPRGTWTAEQRQEWMVLWLMALNFLYPESK
jgi:hypothetical protein